MGQHGDRCGGTSLGQCSIRRLLNGWKALEAEFGCVPGVDAVGDQRVPFLLGLSLKPEPAECARGLRGRPMTGMPTRVTFRVAGFPSIAFPLA